jgi:hypothetical protein
MKEIEVTGTSHGPSNVQRPFGLDQRVHLSASHLAAGGPATATGNEFSFDGHCDEETDDEHSYTLDTAFTAADLTSLAASTRAAATKAAVANASMEAEAATAAAAAVNAIVTDIGNQSTAVINAVAKAAIAATTVAEVAAETAQSMAAPTAAQLEKIKQEVIQPQCQYHCLNSLMHQLADACIDEQTYFQCKSSLQKLHGELLARRDPKAFLDRKKQFHRHRPPGSPDNKKKKRQAKR